MKNDKIVIEGEYRVAGDKPRRRRKPKIHTFRPEGNGLYRKQIAPWRKWVSRAGLIVYIGCLALGIGAAIFLG